jgi:transcriptional antiterminator RfaH
MRNNNVVNALHWYAVHTHVKQESRAADNLRAWNIEIFFPRIRDYRLNKYTEKLLYVIKPLFPGYIFAHFELDRFFHKVRFTRGVHSIVSLGDTPVPVDERVIEIITARIDQNGFVRIGEEIEPGAKVLIKAGPFKGLTGIFERETGANCRVKILLDSVYYQARVEIDKEMVEAICS